MTDAPFDGSVLSARALRAVEWLPDERMPKGAWNTRTPILVGWLGSQKVLLKLASDAAGALVQAAIDECKPLFGFEKMGVHPILDPMPQLLYGRDRPSILMRYHANLGDLMERRALVGTLEVQAMLRRVATWEAVIRTIDRTLSNIVVLPGTAEAPVRFLLIDDAKGFLPVGQLKVADTVKAVLLRGLAADAAWASWVEAVQARADELDAVLTRCGFGTEGPECRRRLAAAPSETRALLCRRWR